MSVLTLNVLGIPLLTRRYHKRLGGVISQIKKLNPDIVCLQEIWLKSGRDFIIAQLKGAGYRYFFAPRFAKRLNGFLTLSKIPIVDTNAKVVDLQLRGFGFSLAEFIGAKGFSRTTIDLGGGKRAHIINTHFAVDWSNKFTARSRYNKGQSACIEVLERELAKFRKDPIVVAGDFNLDAGSEIYKQLLEETGLKDTLSSAGDTTSTILPNLFVFWLPQIGGRRDMILCKNLPAKTYVRAEIALNEPLKNVGYLSDHAAVLAKFGLAGKGSLKICKGDRKGI